MLAAREWVVSAKRVRRRAYDAKDDRLAGAKA